MWYRNLPDEFLARNAPDFWQPFTMPNIKALRQRLAELTPVGLDIGEALRPGTNKTAKQVTICKLVSLIHKAKPKRNFPITAGNKFLRMQICSRVNYCDFDLHVGARVDEHGQCWLVVIDHERRANAHFEVPATWRPETLLVSGAQKLLLLAKQFVQSVPLGAVYSVRYVNSECDDSQGLAVQASTGGALCLVRNITQAEVVAEELYRRRYSELAGI